MFASSRFFLEEKSSSQFLPSISGDDIRQHILNYHHEKIRISSCYRLLHPVSKFMRSLERFYEHTIHKKSGLLTADECFELAKILFLADYKSSRKSDLIRANLEIQFDRNLANAIRDSKEYFDSLRAHFEVMCKSPQNASYLAVGIYTLDNRIALADQLGIKNALYATKLKKQILEQPDLAVHLFNVHRALMKLFQGLNKPEEQTPQDFIKIDILFYILFLLKDFESGLISTLMSLDPPKLQNLAKKAEAGEFPLKKYNKKQVVSEGKAQDDLDEISKKKWCCCC